MSHSISTMVALCITVTVCGGCAIQQGCLAHPEEAKPGWITITGSAIPSTTTPVEPTGESLVSCLLESKIVKILEQQETRRTLSPLLDGRKLTESESNCLLALLLQAEKSSTPAIVYGPLVQEVERLQLSVPQLLPAEALTVNYAFDAILSTVQDRTRLEMQISQIEDHNRRQNASEAYTTLVTVPSNTPQFKESMALLNQYVQSGTIVIEESQKARSWSYNTLKEFQIPSQPEQSSRSENLAVTAPSKAQNKVASLLQSPTNGARNDSPSLNYAASPVDPLDSIFVIVERHQSAVVIVALDSVFDSPVGGLWLFPGDQLKLMHLRDLRFLEGQVGDKRIGLTGMTAQRGIVETGTSQLKPFLYQVDELVDVRSNLLVVNYPIGTNVVKLLMPYSPTLYAASPSMHRLAELQSYIGLVNGAVVTLDHTDICPLLEKSREFMQEAAATQARGQQLHLCAAKESKAKVLSTGKTRTSNTQAPEVPIVSDACDYMQQTSKATWKLAENWWQNVLP